MRQGIDNGAHGVCFTKAPLCSRIESHPITHKGVSGFLRYSPRPASFQGFTRSLAACIGARACTRPTMTAASVAVPYARRSAWVPVSTPGPAAHLAHSVAVRLEVPARICRNGAARLRWCKSLPLSFCFKLALQLSSRDAQISSEVAKLRHRGPSRQRWCA